MPARPRIAPTEVWSQIEPLARAPGQRTSELIRPVVRFGQSAAERAAETGAAERTLSRRRPAAALHWVCGKLVAPAELHRIFSSTRFGRGLDRARYARFRRWRVNAERGLGGEPVAVWLDAEHLTFVDRDEPLAQYRVADQPDQRRLQMVTPEQPFETPHRSPQPPLFALGEVSAQAEPGASPAPRSAAPDRKRVSSMSWRGVARTESG